MTRSPDLKVWLRAEGFGDDLEAVVAHATTPLMRAALKGDVAIAKAILAAGGNISARNGDGNNALWLACVEKNLALLDLLIEAGIDIDNRNDNGATALMFAASSGRTEVVALLLARGADIHAETPDGFSAMDMAANIDCLNFLRAAHKKSPARCQPAQRPSC
jgi:thiosulfate/3-mercaptopyruvate sulfurtransferase